MGVTLLLDAGPVEVDGRDGVVGREDEASSWPAEGSMDKVGELLGAERIQEVEDDPEEAPLRDEPGRDRGHGEDLDAQVEHRVLRLAVGEEVFGQAGVGGGKELADGPLRLGRVADEQDVERLELLPGLLPELRVRDEELLEPGRLTVGLFDAQRLVGELLAKGLVDGLG